MQVRSSLIQVQDCAKTVTNSVTSLNEAQTLGKVPFLLLFAQSGHSFRRRGNHVFNGYRSITTDFSLLSGLDVGDPSFYVLRDVFGFEEDDVLIRSADVNVGI